MSRRDIPPVHRLLAEPSIAGYRSTLGSARIKEAVDAALERVRRDAGNGGEPVPSHESIVAAVAERLAAAEREGLLELINGTGVLLHTNLGRAPLAKAAIAAMDEASRGYSNLEFDLERGERGSRYARVAGLLREASGAEDALVVNNCAAAVLLILDTFARGREVVVARSELIEIGGGFRLPDVLARSGATLVEVGTTNKTYISDYERALSPRTALLLRSHRSNFSIEGFVADAPPRDIAALGHRAGISVVEDLGSGALADLAAYGLPHERTVKEAVADGIDLVAFSGDKLLGGPQAGIVVGRASAISRLRANPLLRALRVDKATIAALGATLRLALDPERVAEIPLYAMLGASLDSLRARAGEIAVSLGDAGRSVRVAGSEAYAGGGTLPSARLASFALAIRPGSAGAAALAAALRRERPAVVGRIEDDELWLDLRTIRPEQDVQVASALLRVLAGK